MEEMPHFSSESYIPFVSVNEQVSDTVDTNFRERSDFGQQRNDKNILRACCNVSSSDAPWKRASKYSFGLIGLHEEINDFYGTMCPKEQETELRLKVIEHITRVVHSLWPQAQVEIFGSFRTGLYLSSSDIDMVIFGEWKSLPLSTLSQALENNGILDSDINIIANATVPIIRLVHSPSGIRVDISFNMSNGVESAKLVKKMMKQHPALPKLVLILKQFLVHRGLNEVYNGGMSSYCLTLLIVSFLQGYHKPNFEPSANFGAALLEFFEHYGINFNYDKVSIHFQSGGLYKPRRGGGHFLSVEDPLVSGKNF
ncbi:Terminal nucleotidyltransferase 4B like protein [Argiope bruennichi]|uniref:polynucleotide adenylyltransferase n=1 Tax=Argiope bruennichi TaxID=94029 RepID=A0A8T0FGD2_ARGBR|nr:Terminal nucleotidyltransferase 4B like protein [Argiope bruennichi]